MGLFPRLLLEAYTHPLLPPQGLGASGFRGRVCPRLDTPAPHFLSTGSAVPDPQRPALPCRRAFDTLKLPHDHCLSLLPDWKQVATPAAGAVSASAHQPQRQQGKRVLDKGMDEHTDPFPVPSSLTRQTPPSPRVSPTRGKVSAA